MESSKIFATPIKIDIPGFKGELKPASLVILSSIEELIIQEKLASTPDVSALISGIDPTKMKPEDYRKAIAEMAYVAADLQHRARDVSLDEVMARLQDLRYMCKAMRPLLVRDDGQKVTDDDTLAIFGYAGSKGASTKECDLHRWLEISGLRELADPTKSETAS